MNKFNIEILNTQELVDPYNGYATNFLVKAEHLARYYFASCLLIKNNFFSKNRSNVVFDICCGSGYGSSILNHNCNVYGFDANPEFLDIAQNRYSQLAKNFFCINLDDESLEDFVESTNLPKPNIVTCFESLEHLKYPEKVLDQIYKLLSVKGLLLLSVPSDRYESRVLDKPANKFHLHFFNIPKIREMLTKAGFVDINFYGQPWTNILLRTRNRKVIRKFDKLLASKFLFHFVSAILGWPNKLFINKSNSIIVVCQKKH